MGTAGQLARASASLCIPSGKWPIVAPAEGALAGAIYLAGSLSFSAMAQGAPPNFAPNSSVGWYAYNRQFMPPPSGPSPVQQDPARPYISPSSKIFVGDFWNRKFAELVI